MAFSTHLILCALVTRRLPPPPESALRKQRQLWANPAQPPSRLLLINPPTPPSYNKSQHSISQCPSTHQGHRSPPPSCPRHTQSPRGTASVARLSTRLSSSTVGAGQTVTSEYNRSTCLPASINPHLLLATNILVQATVCVVGAARASTARTPRT